jgi:GNAT superfamily N-acetyltransferase
MATKGALHMAMHWSRGEYTISTDQRQLDLVAIHAFLAASYWSPGIPLETVRKATSNSLAFGLFHGGQQVGFARVVTDCATFAYLADVYVLPGHRGKSLAKWLMSAIVEHPDLQGLRRFLLATADAHKLYSRFGFEPVSRPERLMEIFTPDIYRSP